MNGTQIATEIAKNHVVYPFWAWIILGIVATGLIIFLVWAINKIVIIKVAMMAFLFVRRIPYLKDFNVCIGLTFIEMYPLFPFPCLHQVDHHPDPFLFQLLVSKGYQDVEELQVFLQVFLLLA